MYYPQAWGTSPKEFEKIYKNIQKILQIEPRYEKIFKIRKIFLLPVLENSIFKGLYLRNRESWTPQTSDCPSLGGMKYWF